MTEIDETPRITLEAHLWVPQAPREPPPPQREQSLLAQRQGASAHTRNTWIRGLAGSRVGKSPSKGVHNANLHHIVSMDPPQFPLSADSSEQDLHIGNLHLEKAGEDGDAHAVETVEHGAELELASFAELGVSRP